MREHREQLQCLVHWRHFASLRAVGLTGAQHGRLNNLSNSFHRAPYQFRLKYLYECLELSIEHFNEFVGLGSGRLRLVNTLGHEFGYSFEQPHRVIYTWRLSAFRRVAIEGHDLDDDLLQRYTQLLRHSTQLLAHLALHSRVASGHAAEDGHLETLA